MSFEENYFDFSYSIGSLEHFTEDGIEKVIDKLHKCTRIASYHLRCLHQEIIKIKDG